MARPSEGCVPQMFRAGACSRPSLVAFLPRVSPFLARVGTCATLPGQAGDPLPAVACGPGLFLLGQGDC